MHVRRFIVLLTLSTIILALVYQDGPIAQNMSTKNNSKNKFQYLFPVPDSRLNSTETNIIIRHGETFDYSLLNDASTLQVTGSKSGIHQGRIVLAENNKTLIFYPEKNFSDGEIVTVELKENLKTEKGEVIPSLRYSFETSKVNLNKKMREEDQNYYKHLYPDLIFNKSDKSYIQENISPKINFGIKGINLPADFPPITVSSFNEPSPGNIFFTPFIVPSSGAANLGDLLPTYLMITDNYGVPIFYRKMSSPTFDFKMQKTGSLSYFDLGTNKYYLVDSSYNIIDSLNVLSYVTDLHELKILENGHYLMMSYDYQQVSMDSVIEGGNPNALVAGLIIQELDENKNLTFQWRSWDHFKITDATHNINLTDSIVDYVHGNAIEMDADGNLLISSRHMDEITKINRVTGEILWRLGGIHCKNNGFTFINDPIGFSHQHDIRRLPNGNVTLFDNGNLHEPPFSRAVEYQLDEVNKIATLVWEYRNIPETFSAAMGSARRLENHNTIIGWGTHTNPSVSEVDAAGSEVLSFSLPDSMLNYRAFKFPWKTNLFTTAPESLNFGYIPVGDSLTLPVLITNNSIDTIEINGLHNRESTFQYNNVSLPIMIAPLESSTIEVTFIPIEEGDYLDDLHVRWDGETEGIAQVVPLFGSTDSTITDINEDRVVSQYSLKQNYPNPFNPVTRISYQIPRNGFVTLKIFDVLGNEIETLVSEVKSAGIYDIDFNAYELASGFYIYRLNVNNFVGSKKMLLMK